MRRLSLLLAASAALLPLAASAQDAPPPPPEDGAPPPPPAARGPVTRDAYVARAMERFRRMDANSDGTVTQAEFGQFMDAMMARRAGADGDAPPPPGGGRHGGGGFGQMMFERLDTDHDGKVSTAEAQAAAAQQFDRLDANHDGQLTPDEMHAGRGWGGGHRGDAPPPPQD